MANFVGCLILLLLGSGLHMAQLLMPECERVHEYFHSCLDFLTGQEYEPSKRCCDYINELNALAMHAMEPWLICWCIYYSVRNMEIKDCHIDELLHSSIIYQITIQVVG